MASTRFNVSMPEDILFKIDAVAIALGMSRSTFLRHAALDYIADVRNAIRLDTALNEIRAEREASQ